MHMLRQEFEMPKTEIYLLSQLKINFGIDISVIEGDKEAELIYHGVKLSADLSKKSLIVDIGGGSIEFIIADNQSIFWKKSYPIGVAYLLDKFHPSDPLSIEEMEYINNFLEEKLIEVCEEVKRHQVDTLIGSSGSFETIGAMIREEEKFESEISLQPVSHLIDIQEFDDLFWRLVNSTLKERKKMKGLEAIRLEFIVLASLVVKFLVDKLKIKNFYETSFSLKEGIMTQVLAQKEITTGSLIFSLPVF
ncbi:MAG: hypothetical protein HC906_18425 [Bacteroidales bacterium]|nr:hypothetical protein [Bacteroidales bacterium]